MKLWALVPELILGGLCLVLVPVAGFARGRWAWAPAAIAAAGLVACVAVLGSMLGWEPVTAFGGVYAVDGLAAGFKLVAVVAALIALAALAGTLGGGRRIASAPVPLLFSTLGAVGLISSNDLGLIVLFIQMMSMAGYVLIGATRTDARALEAALKYFIYAAVALAMMAYGLTFLYGLTGSLQLDVIGQSLGGADRVWVAVALVLILVGYGFEIAMVPVHLWAPDTLAGARGAIGGFLSVVPKVAAVGALLRFAGQTLPGEILDWPLIVAGIAAVTMTFGNLTALRQTRLKRLLAYSSIAQAGYVLAAIAAAPRAELGVAAAGLYLAAYTFMNLGMFALAADLERSRGDDAIASLSGLARRQPWIAAAGALSLLSLAGIPPLAGFAGKVAVFAALFAADMAWLGVVAVINMVIGLVYYLRVVAAMVFAVDIDRPPLAPSPPTWFAYGLCASGTLALGISPEPALQLLARGAVLFHPPLVSAWL